MRTRVYHPLVYGFFISFCIISSRAVFSGQSEVNPYQDRRLSSPTMAELEREKKGEVFIYSWLREDQVNRALDKQFERMDSMMFVNTIQSEADEQEDECD